MPKIVNTEKSRAPLVAGIMARIYKPAYLQTHKAFAERERVRIDRLMVIALGVLRELEIE